MRKYLVILLVAAVAFFAVPAMAQAPAAPEKAVTFSAMVWYATFWDKSDKWASGLTKDGSKAATDGSNRDASPWKGSWGLDETVTRFGATFKQGTFTAQVTINAVVDSEVAFAGAKQATDYREWWAQNDFGMFTLWFGHAYTPTYQPMWMMARGGQGKNGASNTFSSTRSDHMKVVVPMGAAGSLAVAFVEPNQNNTVGLDNKKIAGEDTTANVTAWANYKYPKVEGLYTFLMKTDAFSLKVMGLGGYQSLDFYVVGAAGSTQKLGTVKSWTAGVDVQFIFGPVTVQASAGKERNGKTYGDNDATFKSNYYATDDKIQDVNETVLHGAVAFVINPMFKLQAGYGQRDSKQDVGTDYQKQKKSMIYGNVLIQLTPQIQMQPEYARKDNGKLKTTTTSTKKGIDQYVGVEWIATI